MAGDGHRRVQRDVMVRPGNLYADSVGKRVEHFVVGAAGHHRAFFSPEHEGRGFEPGDFIPYRGILHVERAPVEFPAPAAVLELPNAVCSDGVQEFARGAGSGRLKVEAADHQIAIGIGGLTTLHFELVLIFVFLPDRGEKIKEHQALDASRMFTRVAQTDARAQRMPGEQEGIPTEMAANVFDVPRIVAQRIPWGLRPIAFAVSPKVHRVDSEAAGQRRNDGIPPVGVGAHPVQKQERRTGSAPIGDVDAMGAVAFYENAFRARHADIGPLCEGRVKTGPAPQGRELRRRASAIPLLKKECHERFLSETLLASA